MSTQDIEIDKNTPDQVPLLNKKMEDQNNLSHLTSVNLNKKVQILKEELSTVNSRLTDLSQDLTDFYINTNNGSSSEGKSFQWSHLNMTTKMYKKSEDPNGLPDRIYTTRNSLLTEMFKISHIGTIRNIFISGMMMLALQVMVNDLMEKGSIDLDFNLIRWAFGQFTVVLYTWIYMKFSTTCLVYYAFHYWSNTRVDYLISTVKKTDDLKAAKPIINTYDLIWLSVFIAYLSGFIVGPAYMVINNSLPPASAMIVLMEQLRLLMKTYAFVRSNIPRALENGEKQINNDLNVSRKSNDESIDETDDEKVLCPDFSKYLYFLFAPTLVYRDNYPRTSRVDWSVVVANLAQVIGCIFYVNYIFVRFCIPVFKDFNKEHVTLFTFLKSILNCHLSGTLLLLIAFFSFLHCWLNAFAEMLCFGDRMFYKDWWNSTNFSNYYRTWNVVVHDFLYAYIYKDTHQLVGKKYRVVSQFSIFLISALFHEYVLTLALGFFYPVLFVMFGAVGFMCMFLKPQSNSNFWNFFTWIALQIGLGGLMCLYSIEWFARQNCNQAFDSKLYDYLIPRSFSCGMDRGLNKTLAL